MNAGSKKNSSGFSLVEVIIVIGLTVLIFGGLFASFEYSLKFIAQSRAKMTALSLVTDRAEYIRSLPYNDVGTIAGIPAGAIPQNRVVSLNGIDFSERVLIEYVDDPADGVGPADSNLVLADYKKFKIEYSWNIYGIPQSFSLISTVTPKSIETTSGGGTIRVNVFAANNAPLPGIDVRLINDTTTSTINVTRKTDATGVAYFTGYPAAADYQLFISAPGYSSDQTRQATTTLPDPAVKPFALLESEISTMNFWVDEVSDLTVNVFDTEVVQTSTENFDDLLGVVASSSVMASSSALQLSESGAVYAAAGSVMLVPITPATIESWGVVEIDATIPTDTDMRVRLYSSTSSASLISESNLPGNTAGFATQYIDISSLALSTYPTLVLGIELSTTDTSLSPAVHEIGVSYIESRNMLPGTALTMQGSKVIGANASAEAVYKFDVSTTTDTNGQLVLDDIEWDSYTFALGSGYVIEEACAASPLFLSPDTEKVLNINAAIATPDNLRVNVKASDSTPIRNAAVELRRGGTTWNRQTGWCGQAYVGGLVADSDYELEVSAPGFTTYTMSSTTVSGVTLQEVILMP